MKYYYILIFSLFSTISFGQYVPPMFKLHLVDITKNKENFEFQTALINNKRNTRISNNKDIYKVEDDYVYILTDNFNPKYGDIFQLRIKNKSTGDIQCIYVKPSHELSEGEVIYIENFFFIKGNYFVDLDNKKSKYYPSFKEYSISTTSMGFEFGLEIKFLKKYRISDRKLKKL